MRELTTILAGAFAGALIAVVIIFAAASNGLLPGAQGAMSGDAIHAYLLEHPTIVNEMGEKLQAQEQAQKDKAAGEAMKQIGMNAFFDPRIAFISGPENAARTVVEFYDYNCPYCRASLPAVEKFYQEHQNDTRFAFIEMPIKGTDSIVASKVALAAHNQPDKWMALHFALMAETRPVNNEVLMETAQRVGLNMARLKADIANPELDAKIDASRALAKRAGIDGTPTFIVNGVIHPGSVDEAALAALTKS